MASGRNFKKTFEFIALDKTAAPLNQMARRMALLARPLDTLNRKFRAGSYAVRPLTQRFERFGRKMQDAGTAMSLGITLPAAAAATATIATAADFEFSMKKVGVLTRASGNEFSLLRDTAKEIGAQTQFSASDAARGMNQLALSGFKTNQILSAIRPSMDLAAAADMDLGETADIATNILSSFGKTAEDTKQITDKLTYAFTNAAVPLYDLGEAYRMAGGVAKAAGVDFSTVTAMLMQLGDAGHRGTSAGMAIQGSLSRVLGFRSDVAKRNEVGKILVKHKIKAEDYIDKDENVKIIRLLETLNEKNVGKDEFLTLFGGDYGKYIISLRHQVKEIRENTRALESQDVVGLTGRVASVYMQGANGAMNSFSSSTDALMLSVADSGLLEGFTKSADFLARQLQNLSDTHPNALRAGTYAVGGAAAVAGGVLSLGIISKIIAGSLSGIAGAITARMVFLNLAATGVYGAALASAAAYGDWWLEANKPELEKSRDDFQKWLYPDGEVPATLPSIWPVINWDVIADNLDQKYTQVKNWALPPASINEIIVKSKQYNLGLPEAKGLTPSLDKDPLQPLLKAKSGWRFNPFSENREYEIRYQAPKVQLQLPTITGKKEEEKKVSFHFIFDGVPDDIKSIGIKAPKDLRINKEIRHRYRGVYG